MSGGKPPLLHDNTPHIANIMVVKVQKSYLEVPVIRCETLLL